MDLIFNNNPIHNILSNFRIFHNNILMNITIKIINKFRDIYYHLKFKKHFIKWL